MLRTAMLVIFSPVGLMRLMTKKNRRNVLSRPLTDVFPLPQADFVVRYAAKATLPQNR